MEDLVRPRPGFWSGKRVLVLGLAAQSLVRLSYREPVATYATNVTGTVRVLAAAAATASVSGTWRGSLCAR